LAKSVVMGAEWRVEMGGDIHTSPVKEGLKDQRGRKRGEVYLRQRGSDLRREKRGDGGRVVKGLSRVITLRQQQFKGSLGENLNPR